MIKEEYFKYHRKILVEWFTGCPNQLGAFPRGGNIGEKYWKILVKILVEWFKPAGCSSQRWATRARPPDKYLNGRASSRTSILFANEYLMVGEKYFEYFRIIQTPNNQVNIFCKQIFGGNNQHFEYFDIWFEKLVKPDLWIFYLYGQSKERKAVNIACLITLDDCFDRGMGRVDLSAGGLMCKRGEVSNVWCK